MQIGRRQLFAMTLLSWMSGWLMPIAAKGPKFSEIAELRDHVVTALRGRSGVDKVVADPIDPSKFSIVMGDWSSTGDVRNIFGYLRSYPEEDTRKVVERFVASIIEAKDVIVEDKTIVGIIRKREYLDGMLRAGLDILHEPLAADLVIIYMSDQPNLMAPITVQAVRGRDLASVRATALTNMRRWLPKVVADNSMGDGNLYYVEENTMLSPSMLLLDEFWKSIAARFPGDVLIALPRRDQLFIFDDNGDPKSRAGARRLIDVTIEDGFNLLSPMLYARRNGKIVIVTD